MSFHSTLHGRGSGGGGEGTHVYSRRWTFGNFLPRACQKYIVATCTLGFALYSRYSKLTYYIKHETRRELKIRRATEYF